MNSAVMKCKLFHQSSWGPYAYSALYNHETMQCDKCGIIYDKVDESGESPYALKQDLWGLVACVIAVIFATLLVKVL